MYTDYIAPGGVHRRRVASAVVGADARKDKPTLPAPEGATLWTTPLKDVSGVGQSLQDFKATAEFYETLVPLM